MTDTGIDHQDNPKVTEAARWYATTPRDNDKPGVVILRERFGLTALEACVAFKEAQLIRMRSL